MANKLVRLSEEERCLIGAFRDVSMNASEILLVLKSGSKNLDLHDGVIKKMIEEKVENLVVCYSVRNTIMKNQIK